MTNQSYLENSIKLIQTMEDIAIHRNPIGYVVGYSGGKDSDVLIDLFLRSGVKFCVIHNHTTIDAPETVYHIRRKFAKLTDQGIACKIYYPSKSFWQICEHKRMLPTRRFRFCCGELKERQIPELRFATFSFGVRRAESAKRAKKRDSIETRNRKDYSDTKHFHFDNADNVKQTDACYTNNYFIVNPLAYWENETIWEYIRSEKIEINPLYDRGFKRVGCIGCPLAGGGYCGNRYKEFQMYPKYKERYIKLCDRILELRKSEGRPNKYNFKTGEEYFNFWLELPDYSLGANSKIQALED